MECGDAALALLAAGVIGGAGQAMLHARVHEHEAAGGGIEGKILVAEDVAVNKRLIEILLKDTNLEIIFVDNGVEAVEAAKTNHFDLILMDMHMPLLDGYQATKQIRTYNSSVPIIAFTANMLKEDIIKTQEVGCNAHLDKPLDRKQFMQTLAHYLIK